MFYDITVHGENFPFFTAFSHNEIKHMDILMAGIKHFRLHEKIPLYEKVGHIFNKPKLISYMGIHYSTTALLQCSRFTGEAIMQNLNHIT